MSEAVVNPRGLGRRDLFMGDLLSGIVRMFEAALSALALGGGVGLVLKFVGA